MDKDLMIGSFLVTLGIAVFILFFLPNAEGMMGEGKHISKCYQYVNSTEGIRYGLGKCFIPEYHHYETNEVCKGGFLGIGQSCYESSKKQYKSFKTTKCIIAKTGERC